MQKSSSGTSTESRPTSTEQQPTSKPEQSKRRGIQVVKDDPPEAVNPATKLPSKSKPSDKSKSSGSTDPPGSKGKTPPTKRTRSS